MKHLTTYKIFESTEFGEISDNIKEMLHDIADNGLCVKYEPVDRYLSKKYDITISSYEVGVNHLYPATKFHWIDISPTIHRIESYLKEFDYHVHWSVYISGVLIRMSSVSILKNLDKTNPSAIDFEVEIELFTHEDWKKIWDRH